MRKILLSIFIMIFGFQGVAMSAELIDMDLGNVLDAHVKVEAVMRALKETQEARGIDKNNFMGFVSDEYLSNGRLTFGGIYRACMLSTRKQTVCMPFVRSVVEIHNSLVSTSILPYGKLTEQEFNNIVAKGIECPANTRLLNEVNCDTACKRWAIENICLLNGALWVDNHSRTPLANLHCICNPDEQTSMRILYGNYTSSHFVPSWYEYNEFQNNISR